MSILLKLLLRSSRAVVFFFTEEDFLAAVPAEPEVFAVFLDAVVFLAVVFLTVSLPSAVFAAVFFLAAVLRLGFSAFVSSVSAVCFFGRLLAVMAGSLKVGALRISTGSLGSSGT